MQYFGPSKQPKLHAAALAQDLPTSLWAQNFSAPDVMQRIPLGQPPSTTQALVQRLVPFFHIERHMSGCEHSASALQRSSSSLVPPEAPPAPLEALDEEALELAAVEDEDDALELAAPPIPVELDELDAAPPIPMPPAPPEPSSGKHWPA